MPRSAKEQEAVGGEEEDQDCGKTRAAAVAEHICFERGDAVEDGADHPARDARAGARDPYRHRGEMGKR